MERSPKRISVEDFDKAFSQAWRTGEPRDWDRVVRLAGRVTRNLQAGEIDCLTPHQKAMFSSKRMTAGSITGLDYRTGKPIK